MVSVLGRKKPKPKILAWTAEMERAFDSSKKALAEATMLSFPKADAEVALTVDASDTAVGGALEHFERGQWRPLAFFSRQLCPPECKYSAFDRELLAVHLAIRHFRYFLQGRDFTIFTDHKPLIFAFAKVSDPWSARQQRHLTAISEFTTCIKHIAGKSNVVADALSRGVINAVRDISQGVDFTAMAAAQRVDEEIQATYTSITGMDVQEIQLGNNGPSLLCDTSTGQPRPVVPVQFRRAVFDAIPGLSHPSIRTTQKLVSDCCVAWNEKNGGKSGQVLCCLSASQNSATHQISTASFCGP